MCKEDIRVKRKTATETVYDLSALGQNNTIFPSRPDRVSLVAALTSVAGATGDEAFVIGVKDGGRYAPIITLTPSHPMAVVRVEDAGILLTGEVVLNQPGGGNLEAAITEVYFYQELKDV